MSSKASPTMIGAFVLGAILLLLAGIVFFGSGKFLADTFKSVLYFDGSLKGLSIGASVDLEGVHIGTVTDIGVLLDAKDFVVHSLVIVDINRANLRVLEENKVASKIKKIKSLVEKKGLRAQLQLESMVTGQLFVQLAFYPDSPPQQMIIDPLTNLPEIPTIPSTLQQMEGTLNKALAKLSNVPVENMITTLNSIVQGIDKLVNMPEISDSLRNFNQTLNHIQRLVNNLNQQIPSITKSINTTLTSITTATGDIDQLVKHTDGSVITLTSNLQKTLGTIQGTLTTAQTTLTSVNSIMESNAPLGYEVTQTLQQLAAAARAFRVLVDYLERHPNSVLFGKPEINSP